MAQSAAHKHDSTRRATYQDVLDAPAHRVAEIVDGTWYTPTHGLPCRMHSRARRCRASSRSVRSMLARESGICGSWTRRTAPSRRSSSPTGSGC